MKYLKRFNETLNITHDTDEYNLEKFFNLSSNDIKEWIQDFLDEYLELGFEVSVITKRNFVINIFEEDQKPVMTKDKYPTDELISSLEIILKSYQLKLDEQDGVGSLIYYSPYGKYMSLSISKI